jgi:hypothetical protein
MQAEVVVRNAAVSLASASLRSVFGLKARMRQCIVSPSRRCFELVWTGETSALEGEGVVGLGSMAARSAAESDNRELSMAITRGKSSTWHGSSSTSNTFVDLEVGELDRSFACFPLFLDEVMASTEMSSLPLYPWTPGLVRQLSP